MYIYKTHFNKSKTLAKVQKKPSETVKRLYSEYVVKIT